MILPGPHPARLGRTRGPAAERRGRAAGARHVRHIYVHVPFCDGKCRYCGFYSVVADVAARRRFAPLPAAELGQLCGDAAPRPATLYCGGGSPAQLGPEGFALLARSLRARILPGRLEEWSVEVDPGGATPPLLAVLRDAGVTRVSIGVQILDDDVLRRFGRRHDAAAAEAAARRVMAAGFDNWGIDLIAGLPGIDAGRWRLTLERAIRLRPAHVSVYALSVEPGSALAREVAAGLELPGDEAQLEALAQAERLLVAAGYERYEISSYALPGRACRHNLACWRGEDYLGLGPGAASRLGRRRWTNLPAAERYAGALAAGRPPPRTGERLPAGDDAAGRFVFGLRLAEGVAPAAFAARIAAARERVAEWERTLARLEAPGVVERLPGAVPPRWRLTARGREVADAVIRELL